MSPEQVTGLCHLVAYYLDKMLDDAEIIAVETKAGGRKWHYGVLLEDGRVLDSKGGWKSVGAFRAAANAKWDRDFRVVFADVPEEEVEIFDGYEARKARTYADQLVINHD